MATEAQNLPNRHNAPKIENPVIYVPISHLYICREHSTNQLLFMQNKPNFRKAKMNVSIFSQMAYENISNWTLGQNKPNQTQYKPNSNPICRMPKMSVNSILTKDYERNDIFAVYENKPNSNPIQTQSKPILERMNLNFCATGYYESKPTSK